LLGSPSQQQPALLGGVDGHGSYGKNRPERLALRQHRCRMGQQR
jgi:hypothetical protein